MLNKHNKSCGESVLEHWGTADEVTPLLTSQNLWMNGKPTQDMGARVGTEILGWDTEHRCGKGAVYSHLGYLGDTGNVEITAG